MRIKITSLFSGVGAFEQALTNIGVEHKIVNFCEIDKYAIKAYCELHGVDENLNLGDISKVDLSKLESCDMITHGSPCTSYSLAGTQQGGDEGSGTASSLMWESMKIIRRINPKYVIWENVANVLSEKHKHNFEKYLKDLNEIGYNNYYKVLNSKDFGVPQNRKRIFCVSIRKDVDLVGYEFPQPEELKLKLKDILEESVDEKYYLSDEYMSRFLNSTLRMNNEIKILGTTVNPMAKGTNSRHWVHDTSGIIGTIDATTYKQPKQIIECNHSDLKFLGGIESSMRIEDGKSLSRNYKEGYRVYDSNGIACTQKSNGGGLGGCTGLYSEDIYNTFRIRKLMPIECWKLQGFTKEQFNKVASLGISSTQLYKMAGNSITVNVLEDIFKNLLK